MAGLIRRNHELEIALLRIEIIILRILLKFSKPSIHEDDQDVTLNTYLRRKELKFVKLIRAEVVDKTVHGNLTRPQALKRLGDWVLILILPTKDVEGLFGDLNEMYARSILKYGVTTARLRFTRRYAEIVWDKLGSKLKIAGIALGVKLSGLAPWASHAMQTWIHHS